MQKPDTSQALELVKYVQVQDSMRSDRSGLRKVAGVPF